MEGDSLVLFITFFSYFEFHRRIARHSTCEAHIITKIYRNFRLTLRFGDTLLYISITLRSTFSLLGYGEEGAAISELFTRDGKK